MRGFSLDSVHSIILVIFLPFILIPSSITCRQLIVNLCFYALCFFFSFLFFNMRFKLRTAVVQVTDVLVALITEAS